MGDVGEYPDRKVDRLRGEFEPRVKKLEQLLSSGQHPAG
jgi:porphobilinogen deaminase